MNDSSSRDSSNPAARPRVGIVGTGNISPIYLRNAAGIGGYEVVAVADLDLARAAARAEEYGVPLALAVDDLLAHPDVEAVVNLTIPAAHADVARRALLAGKHAYNEKPLATALEDGRALVELARSRGLRLGCAPDTLLGAGLQTCRELIDAGAIGEPVAATANMLSSGPEAWHPDPGFFYAPGGGPLFDMGPYYLTALVNLLGPVAAASGVARASFAERTVGKGPKAGSRVPVTTETHLAGVLAFESGPVATLVTSFDVQKHNAARLEIYGSEGSLALPDPNTFGGPVLVAGRSGDWQEVPVTRPYATNSRGLGVADMLAAAREGRPHRASGELALHVLEVMHAIPRASREGRHVSIESRPERPEPLPA